MCLVSLPLPTAQAQEGARGWMRSVLLPRPWAQWRAGPMEIEHGNRNRQQGSGISIMSTNHQTLRSIRNKNRESNDVIVSYQWGSHSSSGLWMEFSMNNQQQPWLTKGFRFRNSVSLSMQILRLFALKIRCRNANAHFSLKPGFACI